MVSSSSTEHVSSSNTASERELEELRAKLASVTAERDVLRRAYEELLTKHKLLKHQLYVAKAERIDVTQLELEFKTTSAALDKLQKSLGIDPTTKKDDDANPDRRKRPRPGRPGVARRDLSQVDLPKERIEITDPALEGKAERIGFEESYRLGYRKPSRVCIVVAVAKVQGRAQRRIE